MGKGHGKKRVIIENVSPQVEGGRFPAKRVIGDQIHISADIFSDGHDEISASIYYKHSGERRWKTARMKPLVNDKWEAIIPADKLGFYEFRVQGWIDHFTTWKKGLKKKFEAGQDVKVELQIGANMLRELEKKASKKDQELLNEWADYLDAGEQQGACVATVLSDKMSEIVYKADDKSAAALSPLIYKIEVERKKAGFSTWYELFPRSAASQPGQHGTFKDVAKLLPRIAEMGFDTLYFPPIHPIGEVNRKGKNNALNAKSGDPGSPWAIGNKRGGHKAIHPELGTLKDFKDLLKKAESYNIEIALDIAYQCAPDHPYVKEHPEWFKWRPDGTVQYAENPPKKYEDILPINFESDDWEALWEELKSVVDYWIEQGVRVFRVDNPHTKAFPFWEWMIKEVRKKHPEVIFLAEAFTRPRIMERLAKVGFNQSYTYFTWRHSRDEFIEYLTDLTKSSKKDYFRPNFWPNTPDILPPILTYGGEAAAIMRLILAATMSSNYGLYGPVYEFNIAQPHPKKEEYIDNEKYEIKHWDWDQDTRIKEIISRVNRIRKENPALQSTNNIYFGDTTNNQLIGYGKVDDGLTNRLLIVVNLDPYHQQMGHFQVPIEEMGLERGKPYQVHDLLSGDKYQWMDEMNYVKLDPHLMPAHIFKVEQ